jgi:hypothetical protein
MSRKPKKFKKQILLTTLIILCCLNIASVSSSERVAGVKPGEWVEYKIEWLTPPYEVYPTRVRREILDSSGSTINVNITTWYSNGTITKDTKTGDVSDGTGAAALIFIPANLTVGEIVHIQNFNDTQIQGESEREYLGSLRKVVYSHFIAMEFDIIAYWDKIKGVALEINSEHPSYGSNIIIIDDTNMFPPASNSNAPNFGWLIFLTIIAVVLIVLIIQKRRASRRRQRRRK